MNKLAITILIAVGLIVLTTLVVPLKRGSRICADNIHTQHIFEVGLPFSYYQPAAGIDNSCIPVACVDNTLSGTTSCKMLIPSSFTSASLWFDLLVDGTFLTGVGLVLGRKWTIA